MITMEVCTPELLMQIDSKDLTPEFLQVTVSMPGARDVLKRHARCFCVDGLPIAAFGVMPFWSGMGCGWMVLTDEVLADYPVALTRAIRQSLKEFEDRDHYHRIQATVLAGHDAAHRYIKLFGFHRECLMRKYGMDGADHWLYAKVT